ncbi:hypothetical protein [Methylocystis parvus]|uniref:Uncharacterized protein n=1 Tax=Methylocystis parvus TaxID=134 RepID=A0A6B8M402_9HYPH|nr:hypothetical protein [Methylocystis parvus]QGM96469.1 hypothetical protein F7D14_02560 [Methylocystis parvus]WBJ99680.1 hypothetical protein MMG94_17070 [Methylocystis parvus OBBP]
MRLWAIAIAASLATSGALAKGGHKHHAKPAETPQSAAPASTASEPNGSWSIEATTSVGTCPSLIPTKLQIAEGKIASAEGAAVESWGYVDEEGNIVARFTGSGDHIARFHGTLKGGKGSGAWSSSTDMCGGTWKAAQQ